MLFTIAGRESAFDQPRFACERVSTCASSERRLPAWLATNRSITGCSAHLADGRLLACAGQVVTLGRDGRLRPLSWPGLTRLRWPSSIATAPNGALIVLIIDDGIAQVWRVAPEDSPVRLGVDQWVGYEDNFGGAAVAAAPNGDAFLLNRDRRTVTRVGPDRRSSPIAGTLVTDRPPPSGFDGDGGPATEATFGDLGGLDALPDGSLVIADTGNDKVRQVGTDGIIRTIAGGGRQPWHDGAPATSARLSRPTAVRAAADGTVVIASHEHLLRVDSNGTGHTIARPPSDTQGLPSSARGLNTDGRALTAGTLGRIDELDALPDGSLTAYVGDRLALITRGAQADRLAVAIPALNRTLLLDGTVEIHATRPASGRVQLVRRHHVVASTTVRLARGRNRVRLPTRRDSRAAQLRISVRSATGQLASHRLTVIPATILAKGVLERMYDPIERSLLTGLTDVRLENCRRDSPRGFTCQTVVSDEDGEQRVQSRVFLRSDGLIQYQDEEANELYEPPR
jgi:hypothetical protein